MSTQVTYTYTYTGYTPNAFAKAVETKVKAMHGRLTVLAGIPVADRSKTEVAELNNLTTALVDAPATGSDLLPLNKFATSLRGVGEPVALQVTTKAEAHAANRVLQACIKAAGRNDIPASVDSRGRKAGSKTKEGTVIVGTHYSCKRTVNGLTPKVEVASELHAKAYEMLKDAKAERKAERAQRKADDAQAEADDAQAKADAQAQADAQAKKVARNNTIRATGLVTGAVAVGTAIGFWVARKFLRA